MKKKELSEYDKYLIKEEWIDVTAPFPMKVEVLDEKLLKKIKKIIKNGSKED